MHFAEEFGYITLGTIELALTGKSFIAKKDCL
jgi:hypothetical protein